MVLQPALKSEPLLENLQFENRWFLTDEHNCCSCEFRHQILFGPDGEEYEPWFSVAEEWMQEDPERIEGTKLFYDIILDLVRSGFSVDLIDDWAEMFDDYKLIEVDTNLITRETFRFMEGYVMRFK